MQLPVNSFQNQMKTFWVANVMTEKDFQKDGLSAYQRCGFFCRILMIFTCNISNRKVFYLVRSEVFEGETGTRGGTCG